MPTWLRNVTTVPSASASAHPARCSRPSSAALAATRNPTPPPNIPATTAAYATADAASATPAGCAETGPPRGTCRRRHCPPRASCRRRRAQHRWMVLHHPKIVVVLKNPADTRYALTPPASASLQRRRRPATRDQDSVQLPHPHEKGVETDGNSRHRTTPSTNRVIKESSGPARPTKWNTYYLHKQPTAGGLGW